ncbi:MAG: esterase-like activity of phytase family protein, partial [Balneolaceae bacterium]|nr:esterase-like activity of phytase family protein [Balneolaceae bacterium]
PSRIIVYSLSTGNILHEYRYDVNKVFVSGEERGPFAVNGLSDLQAIKNEGHLLALDRNYVQEQGNRIGLYEVRTEGATDIKQVDNMQQYDDSIQPVKKRLVADLSKFGITIDNFEGLTLGPELPDGSRLLLIVSDNNFSDAQQTIFTAFKLYQE